MSHGRLGKTDVIQKAFADLDEESLNMFRRFAVKKKYDANHILCYEGDKADTFYIVMSGRLVVTRQLENDDEDFVLGFLQEGQYFGEMALLADEPRAATVTTIMPSEILEFTKEQFEELFGSSPPMARHILLTLSRMVRETDLRAIEDLEARNEELARAYEQLEAAQADRIAKAALEAQLEGAGRAQRSMLPKDLPEVPNYQFAARFEPARHIGGDFYDVRVLDNGLVSVLLADVSDKGAHAALFMGVARTLFWTEERHYLDPVKVVQAVHEGLLQTSRYDMFVTAIYGILDPQTRIFTY
ncbi:MAG: cyclic nucleotide-binding domain-containing protein, partial [Chloroflexi bacterium]|nr:cyclic nucleotide-binding domain-containing protein [Chloroflexota bacterium]